MTIRIIVSGKVQGVAYRYSAQHYANKLEIKGYAKNFPDGSVEIIAQGREENIQNLILWCHKGPSRSRVENVEWNEIEAKTNFLDFSIR
ncbi:MAG: acylphosphatase [Bacteroidota bacterium]